ncbi:uncharacterized protein LOC141498451 isoform X2 [Macrotis lagotis]
MNSIKADSFHNNNVSERKRLSDSFINKYLEERESNIVQEKKVQAGKLLENEIFVPTKKRKFLYETASTSGLEKNSNIQKTYTPIIAEGIPQSLEEKNSILPWLDVQDDQDRKEEEKLFGSFKKLINENQELRKENAKMKQVLLGLQNSVPFRLFCPEIQESTVQYLRLILQHLENAAKLRFLPLSQNDDSISKDKPIESLTTDFQNSEKDSQILVDPHKVYDILKKAKKQNMNQEVILLSEFIELIFSPQELAEAQALGQKGKNSKKKILDADKVMACKDFVKHICSTEGWKEPSQREFQKIFTAKIQSAQYYLKGSTEKK